MVDANATVLATLLLLSCFLLISPGLMLFQRVHLNRSIDLLIDHISLLAPDFHLLTLLGSPTKDPALVSFSDRFTINDQLSSNQELILHLYTDSMGSLGRYW